MALQEQEFPPHTSQLNEEALGLLGPRWVSVTFNLAVISLDTVTFINPSCENSQADFQQAGRGCLGSLDLKYRQAMCSQFTVRCPRWDGGRRLENDTGYQST